MFFLFSGVFLFIVSFRRFLKVFIVSFFIGLPQSFHSFPGFQKFVLGFSGFLMKIIAVEAFT